MKQIQKKQKKIKDMSCTERKGTDKPKELRKKNMQHDMCRCGVMAHAEWK
jgi:hypothetical protein